MADERLRRALTPDYPFRCKRVLLGDDYYRALQQDNVELGHRPHRRGSPRRRWSPAPVGRSTSTRSCWRPDSRRRTTCRASTSSASAGSDLHERWGADPSAYLGVAVGGFPNFFMLYGPNTNQGGNSIVYILEAGARLVASAVVRVARRGGYLEVRPEAEKRFNDRLSADLERSIWTRCDSYFRSPSGRIVTQWPYTELEARRTWRLRPREWLHRSGARRVAGRPAQASQEALAVDPA